MVKNKIIRINDDCYYLVYALHPSKPKSDADTAILRYSTTESPAILMQSPTGDWLITKKVKDCIFTDIDNNATNNIKQDAGESSNGIDNKEEN